MFENQRNTQRVALSVPIYLIFGTQITIQGQLKDLSLKGAFITVKSSVHMATNDEFEFNIKGLPGNAEACIHGTATISRIAPGEGIAVYFTKMDASSSTLLQRLLSAGG